MINAVGIEKSKNESDGGGDKVRRKSKFSFTMSSIIAFHQCTLHTPCTLYWQELRRDV